MKFKAVPIALIGIIGVFTAGLTGCASKPSVPKPNARPACVSLDSYSNVIEQVMNVQPDWKNLERTPKSSQYEWTIDDQYGSHSLSTTLTADGCVCATVASSHFRMGSGKEQMVGLLQGAAVAPVSDLGYTAGWLEPKIVWCGIGYVLRLPYEAETTMPDGTTWRLTCSRNASTDYFNSLYTLTISALDCRNLLK